MSQKINVKLYFVHRLIKLFSYFVCKIKIKIELDIVIFVHAKFCIYQPIF
jgi:hypothetical protein